MGIASVTAGLLAACAAGVHLATCTTAAVRMRRAGRSGLKWFFISLLATAVPAWMVLRRATRRSVNAGAAATQPATGGLRRCPHCHRLFAPEEAAVSVGSCPRCGLTIDEVHLA
jgi:uncharacterized paraquat-inducible protein A